MLNAHKPVKPNNAPVRVEPYIMDNIIIHQNAIVFRKQREEFPGLVKVKILVRDVIGDVEW
jgi:hypothetical protein